MGEEKKGEKNGAKERMGAFLLILILVHGIVYIILFCSGLH
jgi:hypothetical protein